MLLDMVMPGMDGKATFDALKALNPGVRTVLMSGFASEGRAKAAMDEGAAGFLKKPFRIWSLSRVVAEAVER